MRIKIGVWEDMRIKMDIWEVWKGKVKTSVAECCVVFCNNNIFCTG